MNGHFRGRFGERSRGHGQRPQPRPTTPTNQPDLGPSGGPHGEFLAHRGGKGARRPLRAAIAPGLPPHVMDECVEDLAEAVVAILLSQAAAEPGEGDDASGSL